MEFAVLLPHFGEHAGREAVVEGAVLAEGYGFDAVVVRDHLLFEPHGTMENADLTFYDAMTTLAVVAGATRAIGLGTGALIPFRHPVHLARIVGTLDALAPGRLRLGIGAGRFGHEFELLGMTAEGGLPMVREYIEALRALGSRDDVASDGAHWPFEHVTVRPHPTHAVPIWYCGSSPASARFAVDHCQGWMPGRITLDTVRSRRDLMRERASARGVETPAIGVIAPTSIAATREEAMRGVNLDGLLTWANAMGTWWVKPASGRFETAADLTGSLIAGDSDSVVEQIADFEDAGVDLLVFDLRASFDRWHESLVLLGEAVLPRLRVPA